MQQFFATLLSREVVLQVREDTDQVISAVSHWYSPALRHLQRTIRLNLGGASRDFHENDCNDPEEDKYIAKGDAVFVKGCGPARLVYESTDKHLGDMFTKPLAPNKFRAACLAIGLRCKP